MLNIAQGLISNMLISQKAKAVFNWRMDIKEIRRANLRLLIVEFGTQAKLAVASGTEAAYISQILSDKTKREIGDDLARRLEKASKKPHGWLDHSHTEEPHPRKEETSVDNRLWESATRLADEHFRTRHIKPTPEKRQEYIQRRYDALVLWAELEAEKHTKKRKNE